MCSSAGVIMIGATCGGVVVVVVDVLVIVPMVLLFLNGLFSSPKYPNKLKPFSSIPFFKTRSRVLSIFKDGLQFNSSNQGLKSESINTSKPRRWKQVDGNSSEGRWTGKATL